MNEAFVSMLKGSTNTLGRTEEVVAEVLKKPARIEELYQCFFQEDEWVRLRASSSFKRIWRADAALMKPYIDGWVHTISAIDQPSAQWTFAQMCLDLQGMLTVAQKQTATMRLKQYIETSDDWIVQNTVIAVLSAWAAHDNLLRQWLLPRLERFVGSKRKSVARRAQKSLDALV